MKKKSFKQDMKNMHDFKCNMKEHVHCHSGSVVYGLGFIGALIYYITTAPTFWDAFIGFFKALAWPAFLVYEALKFLGV